MGEELLSSPDAANNGGGAMRPAPFSHSEVFEEHCPYYLSIGMTWNQFWYGDAEMVRAYRKAQSIKNERENQQMWMQGLYTYKALLCVSPILHAFAKAGTKPEPYLDEPFPIDEKEVREREAEKAKAAAARFKMFVDMKNHERKVKGLNSDHDRRTGAADQ